MYKSIFIFLFFVLFIMVNVVYSQTYISEIKFDGDEFVEIYSDKVLNFSGKKVFDDNGFDKFNTLSLIKFVPNSTLYLIGGKNFLESIDIDHFDCNIYVTDKTQVSNGGLKSGGEDLFIEYGGNNYLNYTHTGNLGFLENQTLHYDNLTDEYHIKNSSPCILENFSLIDGGNVNQENDSIFGNFSNNISNGSGISNPIGNSSNLTTDIIGDFEENASNVGNISNLSLCINYFDIKFIDYENITNPIVEGKLLYKFDTDVANFNITYWISDYFGNIVKDKKITDNKNKKQFTPKDGSVHVVNGILEDSLNNCIYYANRTFVFYKENDDEIKTPDTKDVFDNESSLFVSNRNEILNDVTNSLKYEIYRGDTRKRVVHFYLNGDKVNSVEVLNKYMKISGSFILDFKDGINELLIEGLDKTFELEIYRDIEEDIQVVVENSFHVDFDSDYYKLSDLRFLENQVFFYVDTDLINLTSQCYVLDKKTKVSLVLNINSSGIYHLEINGSQVDKGVDELKLTCKYKKSELKSYNYESKLFEYKAPLISTGKKSPIVKLANISNDFKTSESDEMVLLDIKENLKPALNFNSTKESDVIHVSKGVKLKENSYFPVFIGSMMVLTMMILKW